MKSSEGHQSGVASDWHQSDIRATSEGTTARFDLQVVGIFGQDESRRSEAFDADVGGGTLGKHLLECRGGSLSDDPLRALHL